MFDLCLRAVITTQKNVLELCYSQGLNARNTRNFCSLSLLSAITRIRWWCKCCYVSVRKGISLHYLHIFTAPKRLLSDADGDKLCWHGKVVVHLSNINPKIVVMLCSVGDLLGAVNLGLRVTMMLSFLRRWRELWHSLVFAPDIHCMAQLMTGVIDELASATKLLRWLHWL